MQRRDRPRKPGALSLLVCLLFAWPCLACGGASAEGPEEVLVEYRRALQSRRYEDAYALMSAEFRQGTSLAEFRRALEENPREVDETVAALAAFGGETRVEARVPYGLGESLTFVVEDGTWVVASRVTEFYSQRTPRDALRSFVRAMERRRVDVLLRFVPNEYRRSMDESHMRRLFEGDRAEETQQLVQNLRAHLDDPIEVTGERASMAYAERYAVLFVREDGVWKIEDPD